MANKKDPIYLLVKRVSNREASMVSIVCQVVSNREASMVSIVCQVVSIVCQVVSSGVNSVSSGVNSVSSGVNSVSSGVNSVSSGAKWCQVWLSSVVVKCGCQVWLSSIKEMSYKMGLLVAKNILIINTAKVFKCSNKSTFLELSWNILLFNC
jgi:X-X-X-Leu-X-X-Gly heptad repeat protein